MTDKPFKIESPELAAPKPLDMAPPKRGPGRPKKVAVDKPAQQSSVPTAPRKFKMRAKPNWETFDATHEDTPDRLRIDRRIIPDGLDAQWVTTQVFGKDEPQRRADFEKKGWTPVHQEDFDGRFDGMFMPKGADGEITVGGLVLMVRPMEMSIESRAREARAAKMAVSIKEAKLRGGDIPVTLDSQHPTALNTNRISKSFEKIEIPKE